MNTMIDFEQRMQDAMSQVDGKAFSALLDYKLVFPELLDREFSLNKVMMNYSKQRREATKSDGKTMDFLAAAFYCSLPIGVHISNDPLEAFRQGVKRAKNEVGDAISASTSVPSALTTSIFCHNHKTFRDAHFYDDYNYVFIARNSPKISESYFRQKLEALDSKLSRTMISDFTDFMPNACKQTHSKNEDDIQHFMTKMVIDPIVEFFDEVFAEGKEFFTESQKPQLKVNLNGHDYHMESDVIIHYKEEALVNMELKYPSVAQFFNKMEGPHFTDVLTQVFYQCVAAHTPYNVVGDGECMLLLEICDAEDPSTFKIEDRGDPNKPHVEDVGIPIVMKYHLVKKADSQLTMMSTLTAFVYAAYDRLVLQGKRAEIAHNLLEMGVKLKIAKEQNDLRLQKDSKRFRMQTNQLFTKLAGCNIDFPCCEPAPVTATEGWEPVNVTNGNTYRHAQVYKNSDKKIVWKIFDPRKSPHRFGNIDVIYKVRKKVAFESFKTELSVYHRLREAEISRLFPVSPELKSQGFSVMGEPYGSYGPFLELEDVEGVPPNMEDRRDVEKIFESYKWLLKASIIHGDIKADNIRLVGPEKRAVFFDFGFSSLGKDYTTKKGKVEYNEGSERWRTDAAQLKDRWEKDFRKATENLPLKDEEIMRRKFHSMFTDYFPVEPA